ncbi:MAG: hypothetical protein FWE31_02380 [Firmicutes bacterium]|nr:hypothetical protein [Bacillota bacterium]
MRICIIGSSGSGKSYLANVLGKELGLPVVHMDMYFWEDDWDRVSKEEMFNRIADAMGSGDWIVDGSYLTHQELMEYRFSLADLIIHLDIPMEECIDNVRERHGNHYLGFPDDLPETDLEALIEHIKKWHERKWEMLDIANELGEHKIMKLGSREEVNNFIRSISVTQELDRT